MNETLTPTDKRLLPGPGKLTVTVRTTFARGNEDLLIRYADPVRMGPGVCVGGRNGL